MKACQQCEETKSIECFCLNRRNADGRNNRCKTCVNEMSRKRHKERVINDPVYRTKKYEQSKTYRTENPEKSKESSDKWRQANLDRVKNNHKKWRARNSRTEYMREWSRANRDKRDAAYNKWRAAKKGSSTTETIIKQNVWDRDKGMCGICGDPADFSNWHLDHIIPLSRGGTHTLENVQVSHVYCNLSKGNKLPEEMDKWRAQV